MSLIDCIICAFIIGGCVGFLIASLIWYRYFNKIISDWEKFCNEIIDSWSERCGEINESWRNFYDDLIEGLAKAEEEGGSDENDIT